MSGKFDMPDASLEQAKTWLRDRFEKGAHCPLCNQHVKLYKRNLNAAMTYVLVLIYRWHMAQPADSREWLHVPSHISEVVVDNARRAAAIRGDWAKLRHWDMIDKQPGRRPDKSKRVGCYRITPRGIAFVRGEIAVQSHVWLYNEVMLNRPVLERVRIKDTLGIKFSYSDLMAGL